MEHEWQFFEKYMQVDGSVKVDASKTMQNEHDGNQYNSSQSRCSLYAEYASCVGPPKHQGAPLLSTINDFILVLF